MIAECGAEGELPQRLLVDKELQNEELAGKRKYHQSKMAVPMSSGYIGIFVLWKWQRGVLIYADDALCYMSGFGKHTWL